MFFFFPGREEKMSKEKDGFLFVLFYSFFQKLCSLEQKGAITALEQVNGYLVGAVGQRDGAKVCVCVCVWRVVFS